MDNNSSNTIKGRVSINLTVDDENNKLSLVNCHNKLLDDNINFSLQIRNFPTNLILGKVNQHKVTNPVVDKNVPSVSTAINENWNSMPATIANLDQNTKNESHELNPNIKVKGTDSYAKSQKYFLKKGKKGVDSLLEKLENCNKKIICPDNSGLIALTTNMEEKESINATNMSPEYVKSKSPNNREDEVVSPSFSNEDSNDTKQRRKRKLGKPVRLAKDVKTDYEHTELENKILITEATKCSALSKSGFSPQFSNTICIRKDELANKCSFKDHNEKVDAIDAQENNESKQLIQRQVSTIVDAKKTVEKIFNINNVYIQSKLATNHEDNLSQYLINALKDNHSSRTRRNSESSINIGNNDKKRRRKSCDDVRELIQESSPKIKISENIGINEVESQLEKMFAGIIENDEHFIKKTSDLPKSVPFLLEDEQKENLNLKKLQNSSIHSSSTTSDAAINNDYMIHKKRSLCKTNVQKKNSKNISKYSSHASMTEFNNDKTNRLPDRRSVKKSNVLKQKKNTKINVNKDTVHPTFNNISNNTAIKYKGPVIQIKGPKHKPLYMQIVNASREEDEERNKEKRKIYGSTVINRSKRINFQNNIDFRRKAYNSGLFNSTLSVRYDSHTTDVTWICVFCKRGPHFTIPGNSSRPHPHVSGPHIVAGTYTAPAGILSDLFGPYLIGKDIVEDNMSPDEQEITKEQKQGNKNKRSLRHAGIADQFLAKVSTNKKKLSNTVHNVYMGMSMINGDEQRWEIWMHEQCIVWAAGVYITGGNISGLQDAVWDAAKSICDLCGLSGANIECIKRGCQSISHYCCALTAGWHLDSDQYIPKCTIHRTT